MDTDLTNPRTLDRHERGLAVLRRIGGPEYDVPLRAIEGIAPSFVQLTIEFAYGDVLARPQLDLRTRQMCTVAALAALGNAQSQLRYHVNGARNVEVRPDEIVDVLMLVTVFAGFPAAVNALTIARDVFQQRGDRATGHESREDGEQGIDRYARGLRVLEQAGTASDMAVVHGLSDLAPDLGRFIVEFFYGDVIGQRRIDGRTQELAAVAMCTALGTAQPQLATHLAAALAAGATRSEIVEVLQQMALYAGFPAALNGITTARTVFDQYQPGSPL